MRLTDSAIVGRHANRAGQFQSAGQPWLLLSAAVGQIPSIHHSHRLCRWFARLRRITRDLKLDSNKYSSRLRDLGATYFCLESFGTSRQFYRFQCEMPLGGPFSRMAKPQPPDRLPCDISRPLRRHSLQAMENVLAEIELWLSSTIDSLFGYDVY